MIPWWGWLVIWVCLALALLAMKPQTDAADYAAQATALQGQLTRHLRNRGLRDDDNQRLLNGVGTQHDQGHILRLLFHDGVEATNNRAQRDLRPAVHRPQSLTLLP